jgi:autotransporter-associated beta strand protein
MFARLASIAVFLSATLGILLISADLADAGTAAYQAEVLADNPFLYYRLGEASGTVADDLSANMFDGTYVGSPTLGVPGLGTPSDTAVTFDGTTQHVIAPTTANPFGTSLANSSFEFVFSTTTTAATAIAGTFNTGSNTAFEINLNRTPAGSATGGANYLRIFLREDGGGDMGAAFQNLNAFDGSLHHLLFTFDNSGATDADRVKAYFDGVEQALEFSAGNDVLTGAFSNFGFAPVFASRNNRGTFDQRFSGTLDEIALYSSTLTAADALVRAQALGIEIQMPNQWNINGGGSFNVAGNWSDNLVPTDIAVFANALTAANAPATVTLDSPVSLNGVTFQNSNQYILSGPSGLTLTGAATVSVGGTHQITADIVGTAGLTKTNTGTLVLAAAKSYTGTTNVQEGTLLLNDLNAIDNQASGTLNTAAAGTVLLSTGATGTLAAQITGNGLVNLDDALEPTDMVTINRSNSTFSGLIRVDDGTLVVSHNEALGVGGTAATRTTLDDNSTARIALTGGVTLANEVLDMDGRDTDAVGLTSSGDNAWNGVIDGQSTGTFPRFNIESTSGTLTLGSIFAADIQDMAMNPLAQTFVFSGAGNTTITGRLSEDAFDDVAGNVVPSTVDNVGVIKRGSGTLTIAVGANGGGGRIDYWFGPTVIEQGTLAVTDPVVPDQGELRSLDITIRSGTTFDVSAFNSYSQQVGNQTFRGDGTIVANTFVLFDDGSLAPGDSVGAIGSLNVTGNVTLSAVGTGGVWSFDVGNSSNITGDVLAVSGSFAASGSPALTVNVTPAHGHLDAGSRTVVSHSGGANAAVNGIAAQITDANGNPLNTRQTVAINGNTAGQINVVVTGEEAARTWNGNVSSAWDIATTNNWQGGDQQYRDLDRVTFNDSAIGTTTVSVDGPRHTGSVTFSNTSKSYRLIGAGGLVGTGGVSVSGTGQVDLANTGNSYSGATTIAAGGRLQMTSSTIGDVANSGTMSLRTATTVNALVQNGAQSIGVGGFKVFAVEAENFQAQINNGAADATTWGPITAAPADTNGAPAENPSDPSLGGQALIAAPVAENNTTTEAATQNFVTYSLKFTEPGSYYWFGRLRAVDGGATTATGNTPDVLSTNDDSLLLPATDLGNGVADPQTLSTFIDLFQTSQLRAVNAEGAGTGNMFFSYDWYRSGEGALGGDPGFEKIVVTAADVADGSVFQFKVAARESGLAMDKHVFVQNPNFTTDPSFGTITDADLSAATPITTTSLEEFFSPGTVLNVNGDFTMTGNSSNLNMLIGAPNAHDQINVAGHLAADGVLTLEAGNGGLGAQAGDVFDLFTFGSASGMFDNIVLPSLTAGLAWDTTNLLVTGELSVLALILSGDYNGDGVVDAADYTVWRDNLGAADESALNGNGNGMNGVDQGDYELWVTNFGTTLGNGSAAVTGSQAVPEPTTILLLFTAAVLAVGRPWRAA